MEIRIDVSELLRLHSNLMKAPAGVKGEMMRAMNLVTAEGVKQARSILASNGSIVTRKLYNSIRARGAYISGNSIIGEYGPPTDRPAKWVEEGRGPVHARPGGSLRFQIKGSGPYIFAKSVGPAAARPFLEPSSERIKPYANKVFGEAVQRIVNGMV